MKAIKNYIFEILLAVISLCLLVLLVAPYWFGYQMQASYENIIESFSENTGYSYEVVSFDRGWFSTEADLLVKTPENQSLFYFRHQIIHGPVYLGLMLDGDSPFVNLVINGQLLSASGSDHLLAKLIRNNEYPVRVKMAQRMNDDALVEFDIPDISQKISGVMYKLEEAKLDFDYLAELGRFQGELKLKSLAIQNQSAIEISQLILNFNQLLTSDSFAGDFVVSLDGLKLKLFEQLTSFRQVSSRIKNKKQANLMDLDIDLNTSTINAFNEQINSLSLGIGFSSIYYELFKTQFFKVLYFSEQDSAFDFNFFEQVKINPFSFFSEHGSFTSNLELNANKPVSGKQQDFYHRYNTQFNLEVTDMLLKRIYEILTTSLDVKMNNVSVFVDKMQQQNYLEKHSNKYTIRLQSKDDKYLINDLLIPYQDFDTNISNAIFTN